MEFPTMTKFIIVILGLLCCSSQVFGLLDLIKEITENKDYTNIVRVRTTKEMAQRSRSNVVLDFIGLVEQYAGYTAEEHEVTTSDGYVLMLHRVSGSPSSPPAYGKPVVYIGHGLFGSSDFFAVLGPRQSLLYTLADAGYDIWIGNFRGNTYSKRHEKHSTKASNLKYWAFSMDEVGLIDLPLFIDTILKKTGKPKLSYIGFSMGTTISAMLLSARPEYNAKINLVVSIAPVVIFTKPLSYLSMTLYALSGPMKALVLANRAYEILPQTKLMQIIGKEVCVTDLGKRFCQGILKNLAHVDRMNQTVIPAVLKYTPAGASFFMMDQYVQFVKTGKFGRYNYGILKFFVKQNSSFPSEYDLTKATAPQALFYSDDDVHSNARDVKTLSNTYPNVVALEKISGYNHLDYMWLDEDKVVVYERVLQVIRKHSNK